MSLISSMRGTITAAGTTLVGLQQDNIKRTLEYDVANGASPYTHSVRVGNFGCVNGEEIDLIFNIGATSNPTINIIDAWTGATIASVLGTGSIKTSKASLYYSATDFAWRLSELS